jgi:hypothetical protein
MDNDGKVRIICLTYNSPTGLGHHVEQASDETNLKNGNQDIIFLTGTVSQNCLHL